MNEVMSPASLATRNRLNELDAALKRLPQVPIHTEHVFHAGIYSRTIRIPAETMMTNVHIIIPTILFVSGHCFIYGEDGPVEYDGYHIIFGKPGRQNAFYAVSETVLTMCFASNALTVQEAEEQFTDEPERLGSRQEV